MRILANHQRIIPVLLAITFAGSTPGLVAQSVTSASLQGPETLQSSISQSAQPAAFNRPNQDLVGWHAREGRYYQRKWGIDIVDVRRVSSGDMIAFRYVVLDPQKAQEINDKRNTAYLIDDKTGTKLMVPQMEKVGALRTTVTPVAGKMYWMVFANTGKIVSPGSRVDVVIGELHVKDLTVVSK